MTDTENPATELVEAQRAAELLGVSKRTLDRYQAAGIVTPIRPVSGKGATRRFDAAAVAKLAARQDDPA